MIRCVCKVRQNTTATNYRITMHRFGVYSLILYDNISCLISQGFNSDSADIQQENSANAIDLLCPVRRELDSLK